MSRRAKLQGYRVLKARPAESEAKLSYAVLGDLVGAAFDETRAALPTPQERALAAALLREVRDAPIDARTTATALLGVLRALAAKQPVLVAVDDVQWLDAASARALRFASRRMPPRLGLLLTQRKEAAIEDPLGLSDALPEGRVHRLVPGPLSLAALYHMIRNKRGTSMPRPLLTRLAAASGGNPLFALEIARAVGARTRRAHAQRPAPRTQELEGARGPSHAQSVAIRAPRRSSSRRHCHIPP